MRKNDKQESRKGHGQINIQKMKNERDTHTLKDSIMGQRQTDGEEYVKEKNQ